MRWRRCIALFLLLLLLTGCWNRREIETMGFSLAAGFDWNEETEMYEVTVQIVNPRALAKEAGGAEQQTTWVVTATGHTVFDAIRNLTDVSPRKIWWGHTQVLVVGEAAARRGMRPALDFVSRDGEARGLFWVLITRGKAREILTRPTNAAKIGALELVELIKSERWNAATHTVRMHDFLIMLSGHGAATTGLVELARRDFDPSEESAHMEGGPSTDFRLLGNAVFRGDRLIGYLSEVETRGMLWVKGKFKGGIVHVPCPDHGIIGMEIVHAAASVQPFLEKSRPAFSVTIKVDANIGDKECAVPFRTPEAFAQLNERLGKAVKGEIAAVLDASHRLGADLFGFGDRLEQELPVVWRRVEKDWAKEFLRSPVYVKVNAKTRHKGLTAGVPAVE